MTGGAGPEGAGTGFPRSPYVGLIPYGEGDAPFFYGRSREQRVVMANLRAARLTVMYGASGVGKSSVLLAGVIPQLRELARSGAAQPQRRGGTLVAEMPLFAVSYFNAWHDEPLPRLVDKIRRSAEDVLDGESLERWVPGTSLTERVEDWTKRVRTLLVVLDQFEEYFLYHPHQKGPGTLADELPNIVNNPHLRVNVLLSIREDALAVLDRFKGVIPHLYANTLRIDYLDRTAAEEAVRGPVGEHNRRLPADAPEVVLQRELVEAVLDATRTGRLALGSEPTKPDEPSPGPDTNGASDQAERVETPFLQLVMDRLWRATADAGSTEITLQTLDELGGARRIVERHLSDALDTLEEKEEEIAAGAFGYLVTPSKTKVAHTASDLAYWTKQDLEPVKAVLHRLSTSACGHILRTLRPAPGETEPRYEIFHDVLGAAVLDWRLKHEQEREKRELAARLQQEEAATRAADLERQRKLRARITLVTSVVFGVLTLALAAAVLWAFHERSVANAQELAAESRAALASGDPERSLGLALAALDHDETAEAAEALRAGLSSSRLRAVADGGRARACGKSCAVRPSPDTARFLANTVAPGKAAWSPDGAWIASGAERGHVRMWSPRTGAMRLSPKGGTEPVSRVTISADSRWVASVDNARAVRVWAPLSGETRELAKDDGYDVAFSDDGRYVAAATDRGPKLWRMADGHSVPLRRAAQPSDSVALSTKGARLAALDTDGRARIWDLHRPGAAPRALAGSRLGSGLTADQMDVAFSRDGHRVLAPTTVDGDGAVGVFDATSGALRRTVAPREPDDTLSHGTFFFTPRDEMVLTLFRKSPGLWDSTGGYNHLRGHPDFVTAAAFSPDGRRLATASRDGTARIWNMETQLPLVVLAGHVGQVDGVAFSPDGRFVATHSDDDGTARVWSVDLGTTLRGSSDWLLNATWSRDGRKVATAGNDGSVRVYTPPSGTPQTIPGTEIISNVDFSPDGRRVVSSTRIGARISPVDPGGSTRWLEMASTTSAWWAEFSDDGRRIVTANGDFEHPVSLYDARTFHQLRFPLRKMWAEQARFSPDGRQIAVVTSGRILIVDARTARVVRTLKGHRGAIGTVAFSQDGRRLVSGGQDRTLRVWDVRTGRTLAVMHGHEGWIAGVDFGPGGRTVASASADGTTRVWDAATGRQRGVLRNQADSVNSVAFNPRDGSIVSASDDRTAVIARCETCAPLSRLKRLATSRVWHAVDGG